MAQERKEEERPRTNSLVSHGPAQLFIQILATLANRRQRRKARGVQKRGIVPFLEPLKQEAYELLFGDEMRYGLISNFRRSWSKVGERTVIDSQQSFDNRYLFSAVSPLSGKSFHLSGIDGFDSEATHKFLLELKKEYQDKLVILVWDNAPCHRPVAHRTIPGLIVLFLPPYSPQLNPCERFFEELRKATACTIFRTIDEQQAAIEKKLIELADDLAGMKQLLGYEWILRQCSVVI